MADGGSLGQMSYKDASQCPGYGQDSTLARPATFLRTSKATPRMFFAKRQSQFSPDSVYIVVVKKHDEYNPSIGFFHHKKRETGFLAYAQSASDIRTVKVQQSETFFFSARFTPFDASFHRTYRGLRDLRLRKTRGFFLLPEIQQCLLSYSSRIVGH